MESESGVKATVGSNPSASAGTSKKFPNCNKMGKAKTKVTALVVKLVDTLDLGSSVARHRGSSPLGSTENN